MASKRQRFDDFDTCPECGLRFEPDNEKECFLFATRRIQGQLMQLEDIGLLDTVGGSISNTSCTTGKISWKITNFRELLGERNITRVNSVRSQAFFTSQYGYKLYVQLDVFHNFLKNRKDIFLRPVILKGPNDAVNPWPFREMVAFKFINQTDHEKGKVLTYIPDPESACFKEPTSEMNVASAGITYPDVEELLRQGFVKDDTLIIECECKTSDLPVPKQEELSLSCEVCEPSE